MTAYNKFLWEQKRPLMLNVIRIILIFIIAFYLFVFKKF